MTLVSPFLENVELTPGQLAELRAIDMMYLSRIASDPDASRASRLALDDLVFTRVRDMLHETQRARYDQSRAARHSAEAHDSARSERH